MSTGRVITTQLSGRMRARDEVSRASSGFKAHLLARCPGQVEQVWVYGSRARGEARDDSDLDILVLSTEDHDAVREQASDIVGEVHLVNLHFVRTGKLSPALGKALGDLQRDRERAEYDAAAVFTEDMAQEALTKSRDFAKRVGELLQSSGYL